jgi:spermidine/putrescine transport system permease protein
LARRITPYLLLGPAALVLFVFFLLPMTRMATFSLTEGDLFEGYRFTWNFSTYVDGLQLFTKQIVRSLGYGSIATIATLAIGYPMAYWIAFYGGRRKNTYLLLLLLPFLVGFVIRTLAWEFLLADEGIVLGTLKDAGLLPQDFRVLATSFAVICGLTYNFLPFMALPLYVSLERIDPRYIEAAQDLYATKRRAFMKVVFPLSIPGIFAGILLTFIPASADPLNAQILGGIGNTMIGNIIQTQYLTNNNYPLASALSFMLMGGLLLLVFAYARVLGSETIQDYV